MALEAVVFPQDQFGFPYAMGGGAWGYDGLGHGAGEEEKDGVALECDQMGGGSWEATSSNLVQSFEEWEMNSPSPEAYGGSTAAATLEGKAAVSRRKRRRRAKSVKNKEEVENQRMTHIAVERNRRKQMNEYLAVLRSLMPPSFIQRGDQASIVGGAINYVKELEQLLQTLEVQKRLRQNSATGDLATPFADFFTFPQYSCTSGCNNNSSSSSSSCSNNNSNHNNNNNGTTYTNNLDNSINEMVPGSQYSGTANIEVTLVESHANLKVLSRRRPKQLLNLVAGLQNLRFTPLHLNVTSVDQMVLYSFSLKVEDDCQFTSVDEIATAVHKILGRIEEYSGLIDSQVNVGM